jgi:hypothetical protein
MASSVAAGLGRARQGCKVVGDRTVISLGDLPLVWGERGRRTLPCDDSVTPAGPTVRWSKVTMRSVMPRQTRRVSSSTEHRPSPLWFRELPMRDRCRRAAHGPDRHGRPGATGAVNDTDAALRALPEFTTLAVTVAGRPRRARGGRGRTCPCPAASASERPRPLGHFRCRQVSADLAGAPSPGAVRLAAHGFALVRGIAEDEQDLDATCAAGERAESVMRNRLVRERFGPRPTRSTPAWPASSRSGCRRRRCY